MLAFENKNIESFNTTKYQFEKSANSLSGYDSRFVSLRSFVRITQT